jgi:hypothetical protein
MVEIDMKTGKANEIISLKHPSTSQQQNTSNWICHSDIFV